MSDDDELLARILASPDDDALRAAYAQSLTSRGDPRGELIALQLAQVPETERYALYQRSKKLIDANKNAWLPRGTISHSFRRGFLDTLTLRTADFLAAMPTLLQREPLRELELTDCEPSIAELTKFPELARLQKVTLRYAKEPGFIAFVSSQQLRLSSFHASLNMVKLDGLRAFLAASWIEGLTELNLGENLYGDAGVELLAQSTRLRRLENLFLLRSMKEAGARALAASPVLDKVKRLNLASSSIGAGAIAFAESTHVSALEFLGLFEVGATDEVAAALAASRSFQNLRELNLRKNALGDAAAVALARASFPKLEELDLAENKITEAGVAALAESTTLPALKTLRIWPNPIDAVKQEEWRDWDGSWVGSGPNEEAWKKLRERYGRRFQIL